MTQIHKHTNKLIHASSPYLIQHAHNPVNWYPWCDEAFEKARNENKLVLVSIGYSACHWCHVMEHECFEQEDTAAIMNKHFICIKVDREERPDVDQLYMDAVQLLTGRGGWPLNCFTLPDGRPVHGGTYFPKAEWERILISLADFYENKRDQALEYATDLTNGIRKLDILPAPEGATLFDATKINQLVTNWKANFDNVLGGFNWAPKFPMPSNWDLFLQQQHYTKDVDLLNAVNCTLTKMAEGGIYDQVGGGFSRYSVDSYWKVPHFEKMLYDNAQLISLYSKAYQQTKNPLYSKVVHQTISFVWRELMAPQGYFYSALDADSEGIEGKYYLWKKSELQELLGANEPLFSLYFSVDAYGNWEHESNILYKTRTNQELEQLTGKSIAEIETTIEACKQLLLQARSKRIAPGLDDKMICSWNALMIEGLSDAYLTFGHHDFLVSAISAARFIEYNLYTKEGLKRIYKNGEATVNAFAEDYALCCQAFIKLFEATGEEHYLNFAKKLMDETIANFYHEEQELFYFKSKNDKQLIHRKIDLNDDVIPSANSVLANCLVLLGYFYDEDDYHQMAQKMLLRVQSKIEKFPTGYSNWLQVLLTQHYGLYQVVVTGKNANDELVNIHQKYIPNKVVATVQQSSKIPLLADKSVNDITNYYVCFNKTCGLPQTTLINVLIQLT
jgi:uncharacterized protein YyaL (SSP411 family)